MIKLKDVINESDLGLTLKKGKTIKVTHEKSGKELVIIDKPSVRKEYEKIGFFVEGNITEAPEHKMAKHLDKVSDDIFKIISIYEKKADVEGMMYSWMLGLHAKLKKMGIKV
tara:strand:+ start:418 stop:753 length:336 start_codon:yes stop_codon:yes gene_type:complete